MSNFYVDEYHNSDSDQRDYILNLAEPEHSPSNGAKDGRVQKHPAAFQCSLCPKRFTRAYNLRAHLRTHTEERPFACAICGKAFARQHDRERHAGLHSGGEKKYVCKGTLQSGNQWGCGRRFARADLLGQHFRSEAGRECIQLLSEMDLSNLADIPCLPQSPATLRRKTDSTFAAARDTADSWAVEKIDTHNGNVGEVDGPGQTDQQLPIDVDELLRNWTTLEI